MLWCCGRERNENLWGGDVSCRQRWEKTTYSFEGKPLIDWNFNQDVVDISYGYVSGYVSKVYPVSHEYKITLTTGQKIDVTEEWFVNKKIIREAIERVAAADAKRYILGGDTTGEEYAWEDYIEPLYRDSPEEIQEKAKRYLDECWDAVEVTVTVGETSSEKKKRLKKKRNEVDRHEYSYVDEPYEY
jgi:hypothetical protein